MPKPADHEEDEENSHENNGDHKHQRSSAFGKTARAPFDLYNPWMYGVVSNVDVLTFLQVGHAVEVNFVDANNRSIHALWSEFELYHLVGLLQLEATALIFTQ